MSRKDWSRVGLPFQKKLSEEKLIKVKLVNAMLCSSDRRRKTSFLPILHILTQLDKLNVYLNYRDLLPPPPFSSTHLPVPDFLLPPSPVHEFYSVP